MASRKSHGQEDQQQCLQVPEMLVRKNRDGQELIPVRRCRRSRCDGLKDKKDRRHDQQGDAEAAELLAVEIRQMLAPDRSQGIDKTRDEGEQRHADE
jgi:hypothetical protein